MDPHSRRVLEYDKVLALVARNAHWDPGAELVLGLLPAETVEDVQHRQVELREASRLYDQAVGIGAGGLEDVRDPVRAAARGRSLQPGELLRVADLAAASRKTGRYLREHLDDYPKLADRALNLVPFPRLEQEIERAISVEGRVLDSASPRLRQLRSELSTLQARVQDHLTRLVRGSTYSRMLQEPLVTLRDGRFVVPVKQEYRSQFPGLVIDQSSSGATLFMEPWAVVEMGNRVRAAALAEQKEVEAILARLSGSVGQEAEQLLVAGEELAHYDALMAMAAYWRSAGCVIPEVREGGELRLVEARHPLLVERLGTEVVPTTLDLSQEVRTLIVTGPNTGGKTVCLKTTGLVTMMALAGMPVPARTGTAIPFLREVWADIGDEQSIAQNLSTFSSHLTQILRILPSAGPQTMVLLDELGAGTDPSEGSALGMALLEYLHQQGCRTMVTTHLSELKVFASRTEGVSNAAVEFDSETLEPTYRVIMGIPGRSNALRIAARLGLPADVQRRAREHLGKHHVQVEGLLDELEQERDAAERLGQRLEGERSQAERLRQDYEARLAQVQAEREQILGEAAREARELLDGARNRVHGMLRSFRERLAALARVRRDSLQESRRLAAELAAALARSEDLELLAELSPPASAELAAALQEAVRRFRPGEPVEAPLPQPDLEPVREEVPLPEVAEVPEESAPMGEVPALEADEEEPLPTISETEVPQDRQAHDDLDQEARVEARTLEAELADWTQRVDRLAPLPEKRQKAVRALEPGAHVYVRRFGQEGTVLSAAGQRVEVQVGVIRVTVDREDLEVVAPPPSETARLPESRRTVVSPRVDLRGMTVDEALFELDHRIDEASLANMEKLEIIHGKGTGALRSAVTQYLKTHPMVAEHRLGEIYEGGLGVTVVRLK